MGFMNIPHSIKLALLALFIAGATALYCFSKVSVKQPLSYDSYVRLTKNPTKLIVVIRFIKSLIVWLIVYILGSNLDTLNNLLISLGVL